MTDTPFDVTADGNIVPAQGVGTYIKVLAISMHNNESTEANDETVHLLDGSGGAELYGGAIGAIYLPGRGGVFQLGLADSTNPWYTLSVNKALYLDVATGGRRISGTVWWTTD